TDGRPKNRESLPQPIRQSALQADKTEIDRYAVSGMHRRHALPPHRLHLRIALRERYSGPQPADRSEFNARLALGFFQRHALSDQVLDTMFDVRAHLYIDRVQHWYAGTAS